MRDLPTGRAPLGHLPSKGIMALQTETVPRYTCRDAIIYELHDRVSKSHPCIGRRTFWREDVSWH